MLISIKPKSVVRWLGLIASMLIIAHVAGLISKYWLGHGRLLGLVPLFDLDVENNVPTYFSAMLLLLCATLFAVIAAGARRSKTAGDHRYWASLSALFLFLSFDEAAMFHDRISPLLREALGTSGALFDAWVIPYGVLLIALFVLYARFVFRLPAHTKRLMLLAASVYVAGALGLELVGGYYWTSDHTVGYVYQTIQTLEESLELIGLLVLVYALLHYIAARLHDTRLCFSLE